jgi:hypothetical protein
VAHVGEKLAFHSRRRKRIFRALFHFFEELLFHRGDAFQFDDHAVELPGEVADFVLTPHRERWRKSAARKLLCGGPQVRERPGYRVLQKPPQEQQSGRAERQDCDQRE